MSLEKVIRNFGISKVDTEYVKVAVQVKSQRQQRYGLFIT